MLRPHLPMNPQDQTLGSPQTRKYYFKALQGNKDRMFGGAQFVGKLIDYEFDRFHAQQAIEYGTYTSRNLLHLRY